MIPYTNIDRKLTQYQQEDLSNIVQQCKTQSSFKLADIKRYKNYQDTITTYDCSKFNQAISSLSTTLFLISEKKKKKKRKN